MFKIENNKPRKETRGRAAVSPINTLEVGKGFDFLPSKLKVSSLRSRASLLKKRDGKVFSIFKKGDGYRCERIK